MACIHVFRAAYQEAWLLDLGLRLIASVERERKTEPLREAGKSAANGSGASPRDGASRTNVAPGCLSRQADATRAAPSVLLARLGVAPRLLSLPWRRRSCSGTRPAASRSRDFRKASFPTSRAISPKGAWRASSPLRLLITGFGYLNFLIRSCREPFGGDQNASICLISKQSEQLRLFLVGFFKC